MEKENNKVNIFEKAFRDRNKIVSGDHESMLKYVTVGAKAGFTGMKGDLEGEFSATKLQVERAHRGKEYAEAHMAEWLRAGEEFVYPEKLDSWKEIVENSPESDFYGLDIAKAVEIMRILDTDVTISDVVETFRNNEHCGGNVEKLVLDFSKRGPEYMEQFMAATGMKMIPQLREKLDAKKAENRKYAENELRRNRDTKENKTDELARTRSQLDELSAENQAKDANQAVQK